MTIRDYDRLFIGGDWVAPEGTGTIEVISPVTEEVVGRVPEGTEADIDKAVAARAPGLRSRPVAADDPGRARRRAQGRRRADHRRNG